MHVSALLKDYVAFNVWANEQYIQWFKDQPDTVLEQPIVSSFPSVRLTLLHIYAAEDVWLHRLKGDVPTIFLANTFEGSNAVLMDSMLSNSADFRDFVQAQVDAFFEEAVAYKDLAGNAYSQPRAEMIQHCIQHSTFHRGQLLTIGRQLGLTQPPSTDYIRFTRLKH